MKAVEAESGSEAGDQQFIIEIKTKTPSAMLSLSEF